MSDKLTLEEIDDTLSHTYNVRTYLYMLRDYHKGLLNNYPSQDEVMKKIDAELEQVNKILKK